MEIKGNYIYKRALILDKNRLSELVILLSQYPEIEYELQDFNNTVVKLDSLSDLLSYDNFQKNRIKILKISAYEHWTCRVSISFEYNLSLFDFVGYRTTCFCSYEFPDKQTETLFLDKLSSLMKKSTANYWLIGKFSLLGLVFIVTTANSFRYILSGSLNNKNTPLSLLFSSFIYAIILITTVCLIDRLILKHLFPSVVFLWGEEVNHFNRLTSLRNNLLWGVVIAFFIGIFVNFFTSII